MEVDHPSTGPSQVAGAQSASPGQMFHNAAGFGVHGSQFTSVQGNLNIQSMVPYPSAAGTVLSGPQQPPPTIVSGASSPQATVYSESGNYCSQLLRQGRGTPLYVPGPQVNLPAEYRGKGVAIGDVGRITPEGSFDFFFNIYLPATHPINANIPEDFVPLSPYVPIDVAHHDFHAGNYVCSPSINAVSASSLEFPGGEFTFNCWGPSGAVLALPHGSHLEKLENVESMRRYAAKHAESWYKYVNETRGRGLVNGNLLLVTGWEKTESWGMAFYQDVISGFQLAFGPTADAANRYRYRWHGTHCRRKHADSPPVDGTPLNQTTFIHAFAISVCEGIWGKLFGVEICQPADSSTFQDKPGRGFIPYQSRGSSFGWSFFFGSSYSGGKQYSEQAPSDGLLSDASPIPKIIHPSEIIHERILREAPNARVVITHDDDWRDVFRDDGIKPTGQTVSELQQAMFDRFEITEDDGVVFLVAKSHTNLLKDDATITVEEPCEDISTDAPSNSFRILSENAPHDLAASPTPSPPAPPPLASRVDGHATWSTSSHGLASSSFRDQSPMTSAGPSVNGSTLNEQQAKQIDEQDVIIKTLNKQLEHYKSDLQIQMELTSTLETSLVDSEKNLRKARMHAIEIARERDSLNAMIERLRVDLQEAKREVVSVQNSAAQEKQSLEQRLEEERKSKERQQLEVRMEVRVDNLQKRKSKFVCL